MADYIDVDQMSTELKILIVQGQTLVDQTRKEVKEPGRRLDLTCRLQLRDDCGVVEKYIKKIYSGKARRKVEEELKMAVLRLQTTADGILRRE
ncbi:MAG: hypothetical protein PHG16_06510 [Lachnospiraceae bacterium]|nr:hypothetical protein [Lachnospiraceae bacterium]